MSGWRGGAEVRGRRSEVRGRRSEVGGPKSEVRLTTNHQRSRKTGLSACGGKPRKTRKGGEVGGRRAEGGRRRGRGFNIQYSISISKGGDVRGRRASAFAEAPADKEDGGREAEGEGIQYPIFKFNIQYPRGDTPKWGLWGGRGAGIVRG